MIETEEENKHKIWNFQDLKTPYEKPTSNHKNKTKYFLKLLIFSLLINY